LETDAVDRDAPGDQRAGEFHEGLGLGRVGLGEDLVLTRAHREPRSVHTAATPHELAQAAPVTCVEAL
jgi:hypothetical protein